MKNMKIFIVRYCFEHEYSTFFCLLLPVTNMFLQIAKSLVHTYISYINLVCLR